MNILSTKTVNRSQRSTITNTPDIWCEVLTGLMLMMLENTWCQMTMMSLSPGVWLSVDVLHLMCAHRQAARQASCFRECAIAPHYIVLSAANTQLKIGAFSNFFVFGIGKDLDFAVPVQIYKGGDKKRQTIALKFRWSCEGNPHGSHLQKPAWYSCRLSVRVFTHSERFLGLLIWRDEVFHNILLTENLLSVVQRSRFLLKIFQCKAKLLRDSHQPFRWSGVLHVYEDHHSRKLPIYLHNWRSICMQITTHGATFLRWSVVHIS